MIFLLDAGHSGVIRSEKIHYLTKGKRSPEIPPGIYEGEFNRIIARKVATKYFSNFFKTVELTPGPIPIPLKQRYETANQIHEKEECFLLSIHANAAAEKGWSDAHGTALFIARNASKKSRWFAKNAAGYFENPNWPFNFRGIKERNFAMIRNTKCPAALLEIGFMTNLVDVSRMTDPKEQDRIAYWIHSMLCDYADYRGYGR